MALKCMCDIPKRYILSDRTKRIFLNNKLLLEHNVKFLINLYLNMARTSLSVGASGFIEILKNKFEINYTQPINPVVQQEKKDFFGWGGKKQ
jgi:hypothetical protein